MPFFGSLHYPAGRHRAGVLARFAGLLRETASASKTSNAMLFLAAGRTLERDDTDRELPHRTESNFFYMTGCESAGSAILVDAATGKTTLVVPYIDADTAVWIGTPPSLEEFKTKYKVDSVVYDTDIAAAIEQTTPSPREIHSIPCADKTLLLGAKIDVETQVNTNVLLEAIQECRVFKDEEEIAILRHINGISSRAHDAVLKAASTFKNERDAAGLFLYKTSVEDAPHLAYETIAAAATRAATLHYTGNNRDIASKDDLVLLDAGAEFHCHASDITRTFPAGGKFSFKSKNIYEIVLETQKAVIDRMKPGVKWEDLHRLAVKLIGEGLIAIGIITTDIDTALKMFIPQLFMPHGIGHFLGLDVHDVGGYPKGVERIQEPSIRYLRVLRDLKPGMVLTVEPGLYFVKELLDEARKDHKLLGLVDWKLVDEYAPVGGVRIEDNIVVTETGHDNLTVAIKEIKDIETVLASQQ